MIQIGGMIGESDYTMQVTGRLDMAETIDIIDFTDGDGLDLPLKDLPIIPYQKRKRPATNSMPEWKICGADTETNNGRCFLFSTEKGVYYIDSLFDLVKVLYNKDHASKWTRGKKSGKKMKQKINRGYSTKEFFFYNLKFDATATVLHYCDPWTINELLNGESVEINIHSTLPEPVVAGEMIKIKYLEGKYLELRPLDWFIGQYKIGPCYWWDISQFYNKRKLNDMAKEFLHEEKVEKCYDGTILDVTRLGEDSYREKYKEDIAKYALQDAILAGKLTRLKREEYLSQEIRFIRPYSLANVAQRNLLDFCEIPVINPYLRTRAGLKLLQAAYSSFQGGWFESSGAGVKHNCVLYDLNSAYPFAQFHLPNTSEGHWIYGDEEKLWWLWCEERSALDMGFAEVTVQFEDGMQWHPLVKTSPVGTLVGPQIISGWFTADEIVEARKWPCIDFIVGEWYYFVPESDAKPFRPFIDKFYGLKQNSPKGSVVYRVSKVSINSIFGKTCQKVNNKAGSLWNPIYASTITGFTRSRIAEAIRTQGFKAVSVATDGIGFERQDFVQELPSRPLPAPYSLGEWESDGEGDMLIQMSGVYSVRNPEFTKTLFRGSASYFLRPYFKEDGLFGFCRDNHNEIMLTKTVNKPYSAKEARAKSDYSLMNVFEDRVYSMRAIGDSTKRVWRGDKPECFGDLLTNWYQSTPHRQIQGLDGVVDNHE